MYRIPSGTVFGALALLQVTGSSAISANALNSYQSPQAVSRVTPHDETQVFSPNCKATRKWVEVVEPASPGTQVINSWIRRKMTLRKKLQAKDCLAVDNPENYEYANQLTLTGIRDHLIGFHFRVAFPGGTGRFHMECSTFDLRNGDKIVLSKFLNHIGRQSLSQAACKQSPEGACEPGAIKTASFCLTNQEIEVGFPYNGNWRLLSAQFEVEGKDLYTYFSFPKAIKREMEKAAP